MDRLLRRKPVKKPDQYVIRDPSYYQPSQLAVKSVTEYSAPYRQPTYFENVDKSSESAVTASQTIKSLEAAYTTRRSLSYPLPQTQTEARHEQNHAQQENMHLRRRSTNRTTTYGSDSSNKRGLGGASEQSAPHAITTNGAEVSEATNAYQSYNEASYPLSQAGREPETRSLRSTRYSRHSSDDKQQAPWTRLSGFNRFEEPSPISPTTSPNPSIRPPSFAENNPDTSLGETKPAKLLFKEKIQWSNESQVFIPEASEIETDLDVSVGKDDDDLSSICSEDSYLEKERTRYYESMVTEAVNIRDWKAAKGHATKLKEILGLQKEHTSLDPPTQANYFLLCGTIHYMLAELEDALFWIRKIPAKKSTDPTTLMNRFNMESAIAIRQGNLDSAFAISKKAGKYGRKFGLAKETNHAHYLSQLICLKRDDTSEAQFYGQMITEKDFKLPIFIETIDAPVEEESGKQQRKPPEEVYKFEPLPRTPDLPPKQIPNIGEALFTKAGLSLRSGGAGSRGTSEYQGGTVNWTVGIRLAVDADDDSESACYLYRTVYINEPVHFSPSEPQTSQNKSNRPITPLEYAIIKRRTYAAIAMIKQNKAYLEDDNFDAQPIQLAADRANLPVMVALLQAGVDPHRVGTVDNVPALEKVASASYYEGCAYLLMYGADPLKLGPTDRNALKVALEGTPTNNRKKVIRCMLASLKSYPQYSKVAEYFKAFSLKLNFPAQQPAYPKSFLQVNPTWNAHIDRLLSEYLETFSFLKGEE